MGAGKTIQIYLPDGDPRGIRIAEITTRIVQVIEVPRSLLPAFLEMPEARQVALYYLVGGSADGDESKVYIGQTGDVVARLASHQKNKDFWDRALVLISRTNSLTQTHALFLEWHCLKACQQAGRYALDNGNAGSKPHTPAPLESDCLEIFETGSTLLATLGYPLFDPVAGTKATQEEEHFHCTASGVQGHGVYTSEGFVVLKGSVGRLENVKSLKGTAGAGLRQRLLDAGVMVPEGDRVIFTKDHLFRSPSMAGLALLGRTCNGWVDWKTKDGRTLDEVKRRDPAT
jgi:predicted GIY-YIG superfamily endonuclease